jgi:hypothetical protein
MHPTTGQYNAPEYQLPMGFWWTLGPLKRSSIKLHRVIVPTDREESLISILSLLFPRCFSKQNSRLHACFLLPVLAQNFRRLTPISPPRRSSHSMNVKQQCVLWTLGWVTAWEPLMLSGFSTSFQALKRARMHNFFRPLSLLALRRHQSPLCRSPFPFCSYK